jgi:hypothetical protein
MDGLRQKTNPIVTTFSNGKLRHSRYLRGREEDSISVAADDDDVDVGGGWHRSLAGG